MATPKSKVQLIVEAIDRATKVAERIEKSVVGLDKAQKRSNETSKKAEIAAARLAAAQSRAAQAATRAKAETERLSATQSRSAIAATKAKAETERLAAAQSRAAQAATRDKVETERLALAKARTALATKRLADAETRATTATRRHGQAQSRTAGTLVRVARRVVALAVVYLGLHAAIGEVSRELNTVQVMDRVTQSLAAVTGDAAGEFAFLRAEADRLGVSLPKIALEYSKITAAGRAAGISGKQIKDVFVAINEAAVVLGLSGDDIHGTLRAIGQMMSKGTVQAEELKGQLGERLPGAFGLAAKAMGKTTQELGKLLETGDVTAEELLPKLAIELQKTFSGQLPEATKKIARNIARVGNAVFLLRAQFAQPIADTLSPIIGEISKELNDLFDSGQMQELGKRVAAFVQLVVESWRTGKLDEVIALTIEAGFEKGSSAASDKIAELADDLPSLFVDGMINLGETWIRITTTVLRKVIDLFSALFIKIQNFAQRSFIQINNFLGEHLETGINKILAKIQTAINASITLAKVMHLPGSKKLEQVDLGQAEFKKQTVPDEKTFADIYGSVSAKTAAAQDAILEKVFSIRDAVLEYIGVQKESGRIEQSAAKELARLLDEVIAKQEEVQAAKAAANGNGEGGEDGATKGDPAGGPSLTEGINEGFDTSFDAFAEKIGTVADIAKRSFDSIFTTLRTGGANVFQMLIGNTAFWSRKLGNIAGPVMGALTGAVSKFFTEWMLKRILVDTLETGLQQKQTALTVAQAAIKFAANLPAAIAAGIGSFGAAAAIGTAAVLAAVGVFSGAIKLADGMVDIRGPGGARSDLIPAMISDGESVINGPATALNKPYLEYANDGGNLADVVGSGSGGSTIYVVGTDAEARNLAANIPDDVRIRNIARSELQQFRA